MTGVLIRRENFNIYIYIYIYIYIHTHTHTHTYIQKEEGFPDGSVVKNLPAKAGDIRDASSIPGLGRCPGGQPTPVFLPRESHGQKSLANYSPWGHGVERD